MKRPIRRDETGHIIPNELQPYNDRLFKNKFRNFFHEARFRWLQTIMRKLNLSKGSVAELGCFDAKTLNYLPFIPEKYCGYDADWENGIELAVAVYGKLPYFFIHKSNSVNDFNPQNELFDYTVIMETFEHLPIHELDAYLQKLRKTTNQYVFITVPVERGPVPVIKYLIKKIFLQVDEPYSIKELWYTLFGKLDKIERVELGHKGFNYSLFLKQLSIYFEIIETKGIPFGLFPPIMNFSICILAKPR